MASPSEAVAPGGTLAERINAALRDVPDFPEPGVIFKDIAPLLADGSLFAETVAGLAEFAADADAVAGVEARGFLFAAAVARELGCGLIPVRKAGKLPPPTITRDYQLEYGTATIEVPTGLLEGRRVFLVDDVLATGGTLRAAAELVAQAGARVTGIGVLLEIGFLGGAARLDGLAPLHALVRS